MDLVVRTPRFVSPGETLTARSWCAVPGGKGANQAVAAARLGAKTHLCGCIGRDSFGASLREAIIQEGIDISGLTITEACGTGIAMIAVEDSGRNAIYVVGGANHVFEETSVRHYEAAISQADFLLLQLEVPLLNTVMAMDLARGYGRPVLLDPAPAPLEGFPDKLLQVDLISPNETETEALTGICPSNLAQAKRAALDLQNRGAKKVVIKLGERGALALDPSGSAWHVSAPTVQVVDTTAAGDAFSAALAVALAEGNELAPATQFACAAGAIAVGKAGAQPSMPTRDEVLQIREKHEFRATAI